MSSSKEDLRKSLNKISTQDFGDTVGDAMDFFKDSFNVFDDKDDEESPDAAEEREYVLENRHSFANRFEVLDESLVSNTHSYRPLVAVKNEICAKAYMDRLPCKTVRKMPECVGDSFNFGNY